MVFEPGSTTYINSRISYEFYFLSLQGNPYSVFLGEESVQILVVLLLEKGLHHELDCTGKARLLDTNNWKQQITTGE